MISPVTTAARIRALVPARDMSGIPVGGLASGQERFGGQSDWPQLVSLGGRQEVGRFRGLVVSSACRPRRVGRVVARRSQKGLPWALERGAEMENSKIGWTDHTWNPWQGCNKVSDGCKFCYIGGIMRRAGREPFAGPIRTSRETWRKPRSWDRAPASRRARLRVFTCSMSDFFHPDADQWRHEAWAIMRQCTNLDWLVLTKRPELIRERLPADWGRKGYPNVWLGVTVEHQGALHRVRTLAKIPAAIRFVSAEPLLGPIDFTRDLSAIDWIITGCERAHRDKRRPMDLDWVRSIHRQCAKAGIAHYYKQYYVGNQIQEDGVLDGVVCQQWPVTAAWAPYPNWSTEYSDVWTL